MIDVGELQRQLDPMRPLTADDAALYVDCQSKIHPDGADAKSLLSKTFARNANADRTLIRLITGLSGCGKTTELRQVCQQLNDGQHGKEVFVSFLFAEAYLDLEDVTPEELLYQIVRQLADDLSSAGMRLRKHKIGAFFTSLWDKARTARLTSVSVAANPFSLGFTSKDLPPSGRQKFRSILRTQAPTLFEIVNSDLLPDARTSSASAAKTISCSSWMASTRSGPKSWTVTVTQTTRASSSSTPTTSRTSTAACC